jgi:hypothetical protein
MMIMLMKILQIHIADKKGYRTLIPILVSPKGMSEISPVMALQHFFPLFFVSEILFPIVLLSIVEFSE